MTVDKEDGRQHSAASLGTPHRSTSSSNDHQTPRIKNHRKVNLECFLDRAMNEFVMRSSNQEVRYQAEDGKEEGEEEPNRPQHFMGIPPLPGLGISHPQQPPPPPAPTQTRSRGHPPIRQDTNPNTPPRREEQQQSSSTEEPLLLIDVSERDSPTPSLVAATPYRSSSRHNNNVDDKITQPLYLEFSIVENKDFLK